MSIRKATTNARFARLFQPVLSAISSLGGSARPTEVKEWILHNLKLSEDYVTAVHKSGASKFGNDVNWARFYLVRSGHLNASTRGVWSLTELGRGAKIDSAQVAQIIRNVDAANA